MTPSSIGLVLVEGNDADGFAMGHNAVEIVSSEDATAAVLRSEALAATRGLRLKTIGLTWSEDADAEASMLLQSLSESGFDNVVPVRIPEATEAVARGIADALGCATTAVCAIEPDIAITLIVHAASGAVHTAVNHTIDSDAGLTSWLSAVFTRADWQPEALVVIGSAGNFDHMLAGLQDALSVPVFTPEEAELALARGAALVSVRGGDAWLPAPDYAAATGTRQEWDGLDDSWDPDFVPFDRVEPAAVRLAGRHRSGGSARSRQLSTSPALPLTMLAVGSMAFVASVSAAVTLQFLPGHRAESAPAAQTPRPAAAEQAVAPADPASTIRVAPAAEPLVPEQAPVESGQPAEAPVLNQLSAPVVAPDPAAQPDRPQSVTDIPPAEVPPNSVAVAVPADAVPPAAVRPAEAVRPVDPAAPAQ
ncbi:MAG: hypothetical protein P4L86_14195 [Mycobacterium sp.]|nr:hypothetical protein [Mycobacterium sp.]